MKKLDLHTARQIINFSGGDPSLTDLGEKQLEGAVALHNMIVDDDIGLGYLADEVGMGKTYIAIGVVILLRYFNPALRVLYICPSRNVQEKWDREYKSVIKNNVLVAHYRIRTTQGKPAVPYVSCRNISELINMASIGYFADFFVGKDSFSMGLSEEPEQWEKRLDEIDNLLPAQRKERIKKPGSKHDVKLQYAYALNYVLPTFDLVVIDEAHNFKHDFESSDRNRVLSNVLGVHGKGNTKKRIKNALLLSATPYDRDLNQLRNQLKIVGKAHLLNENAGESENDIKLKIAKFMVRRLNELIIGGKPHSRNMYRKEWRNGEKAEIALGTDEQKLVMALVQKKVGEVLDKKDGSPAFQMGMLASFESFAESTKSPPVEFDGEKPDRKTTDAQDKHVIGQLVDSYKEFNLGRTLPHPKMDDMCRKLSNQLFSENKKQLIFVRRIKSVKELKEKLDNTYNSWLIRYIYQQLEDYPDQKKAFEHLYNEYLKQSKHKDEDITEGQFTVEKEGEAEDRQPPKNNTFFAWFFRGEISSSTQEILNTQQGIETTPFSVRVGLTAKNQSICRLLELNWARFLSEKESDDWEVVIEEALPSLEIYSSREYNSDNVDYLDIYASCQIAFIEWYITHKNAEFLRYLLKYLKKGHKGAFKSNIGLGRIRENLTFTTLFTEIEKKGLAEKLFPYQGEVYKVLKSSKDSSYLSSLEKLYIHRLLFDICLRTGHGIVDLYISRIQQGTENLDDAARVKWMEDLTTLLASQSQQKHFSTYHELCGLAEQLDLIIKTNVPDIYDIPGFSRKTYLSKKLNPVLPIIGATGATLVGRSAQAARFRMPGYPLALIATDVFQEGEDLHTFCDSVVHYGLSGTPVSIEQKIGRVDRVNSLAQRRLLNSSTESVAHEDKIQVTYPYVKESIEYLQVRQLCKNINKFILSLHDVDKANDVTNDTVDIQGAMEDNSDIPEQIENLLRSPFVSSVTSKYNDTVGDDIQQNSNRVQRIKNNVDKLIATNRPEGLEPRISSSRMTGELLLSATKIAFEYRESESTLMKLMRSHSWNTYHRIVAKEEALGVYQCYFNSEMLIGDGSVTQKEDISLFFDRFEGTHNPTDYKKPNEQKIINNYNQMLNNTVVKYDSYCKVSEITDGEAKTLGLRFTFGKEGLARKHDVWLYQHDGRCIFLTAVANRSKIRNITKKNRSNRSKYFSDRKIIELTWIRNDNTDLVEFVINDKGELVGRVTHAIASLDWEEFQYCAYTLAAESDRLEYILSAEDEY